MYQWADLETPKGHSLKTRRKQTAGPSLRTVQVCARESRSYMNAYVRPHARKDLKGQKQALLTPRLRTEETGP